MHFHETDNSELLCYSKTAPGAAPIVVIVNLDPRFRQSGWVTLDLAALGLSPTAVYEVHDLLHDQQYRWQGPRNYVELTPSEAPAHVFRVRLDPTSGRGLDPER